MKNFEELKWELLSRIKIACNGVEEQEELYKAIEESETKVELLKAVTDKWSWVLSSAKIIDAAFLEENFTEEELTKDRIYTKGKHVIKNASFVCGSAMVHAFGRARVTAFGLSLIHI